MGGVLSDVRYSSSYLVFDLRNEFLLIFGWRDNLCDTSSYGWVRHHERWSSEGGGTSSSVIVIFFR
jgi:hypothetical protein